MEFALTSFASTSHADDERFVQSVIRRIRRTVGLVVDLLGEIDAAGLRACQRSSKQLRSYNSPAAIHQNLVLPLWILYLMQVHQVG